MSVAEPNLSGALPQAVALLERRECLLAIAAFDEAEGKGAESDLCCAGRWMGYMLQGNFEAAWSENDAIRRRRLPDPHRLWLGEDLRGRRVMVRCLHGLGDSIQFLRYAPMLRERAAKLIVEVPPALLELAPLLDGVGEVITWGKDAPSALPAWDVQIEVTELPYVFRTLCSELPLATSYLRLPATAVEKFRLEYSPSGVLRVGVVWAAGAWNPTRSVPLASLKKLLQTSGCEFWNLQGGAVRQEWTSLRGYTNLRDGDGCSGSILGLSALISQMDLVITPDTFAAHLAGALGVPACVLLERAADWRWMDSQRESPWYPSLRLFRARVRGEWAEVVDAVQIVLQEEVCLNRKKRGSV